MPDETYTGPFTGHAMRPDRETYERFKAELTKVDQMDLDFPDAVEEQLQGTHPRYGIVSLSRMSQSAARPNAPSYLIIILTDDEAVANAARLELDTDPMP